MPKNCFLKPFSTQKSNDPDDRWTWVYNFGREPSYRNLNSVSVVKHFYSFIDSDGNKDDQLEDFLAFAEKKLAPTAEKLILNEGDRGISIEERANFANFVGMMLVRTPQYRKQLEVIIKQYEAAWEEYNKGGNPAEIVKQSSNAPIDKLGFDKSNAEIAHAFFENQEIMQNVHVISLWRQCELHAKIIFEDMHWAFIVPEEEMEFVTCDDPVGRYDEVREKALAGIANKQMCIYFPLSPKLCFYAYHDDTEQVDRSMESAKVKGNQKEVELVNRRMLMCATRDVYSLNLNPEIQKIVKESDPDPII